MFEENAYMFARTASSRICFVMRSRPSRFFLSRLYLHIYIIFISFCGWSLLYSSSLPFIILYFFLLRKRNETSRYSPTLRLFIVGIVERRFARKKKETKEKEMRENNLLQEILIDQIIATHVRY